MRGVAWIAGIVAEEAERVQAAESSPQRRLGRLEAALARGELSPDEAAELEAAILEDVLSGREGR